MIFTLYYPLWDFRLWLLCNIMVVIHRVVMCYDTTLCVSTPSLLLLLYPAPYRSCSIHYGISGSWLYNVIVVIQHIMLVLRHHLDVSTPSLLLLLYPAPYRSCSIHLDYSIQQGVQSLC